VPRRTSTHRDEAFEFGSADKQAPPAGPRTDALESRGRWAAADDGAACATTAKPSPSTLRPTGVGGRARCLPCQPLGYIVPRR
jgi:hypothetical protein